MNSYGIEQPEPAGFPQLPASGKRASLAAGVKCFCLSCMASGEDSEGPCPTCLGRGTYLRFLWPVNGGRA